MDEETSTTALADRLTRWFAARLDQVPAPRRSVARLYGLEVIDPDGIDRLDPAAVRTIFVREATDARALLATSGASAACDFDATATVEWAWSPVARAGTPRPGAFGTRQRERLVRVWLNTPDE